MSIDLEAIPDEAIEAAVKVFYVGWDFDDDADPDLVPAFRATEAALKAAAPLLRAPLVAEVERLQGTIARQLGECTGCTTEPEETCPIDGRTYADWVRIAGEVIGMLNEEREKVERLRAIVEAVEKVSAVLDCDQCGATENLRIVSGGFRFCPEHGPKS